MSLSTCSNAGSSLQSSVMAPACAASSATTIGTYGGSSSARACLKVSVAHLLLQATQTCQAWVQRGACAVRASALGQQVFLQPGAASQGWGWLSPGRLATDGCAPCSCQPVPPWPRPVQSHLLFLAHLADILLRFKFPRTATAQPTRCHQCWKTKVVCTPQGA